MYIYKQDLALNNLQGLICHNTQPTNQLNNPISLYICICLHQIKPFLESCFQIGLTHKHLNKPFTEISKPVEYLTKTVLANLKPTPFKLNTFSKCLQKEII